MDFCLSRRSKLGKKSGFIREKVLKKYSHAQVYQPIGSSKSKISRLNSLE